jgi:hypothetical protein
VFAAVSSKQTKNETDKGAYYHKDFLRGRFDLCKTLIRKQIKDKRSTRSSRSPDSHDIEPDFYSIPYCKDDDNDDIKLQGTAAMGSARYEDDDMSTHGSVTPISEFVMKGDVKQMSGTSQPLLVRRVSSLCVRCDVLMQQDQHPHLQDGETHGVSEVASKCLDEGSRNGESYAIPQLLLVQHLPKADMSNHIVDQDQVYTVKDEDAIYESAINHLSICQADTLRRMQTLQNFCQLQASMSHHGIRHSEHSLTTKEQSMMDWIDTEGTMTTIQHNSQCGDELMNPNIRNSPSFFRETDDSCCRGCGGIVTASGQNSTSESVSVIQPQTHTTALVHSERLLQDPYPVFVEEFFAGRTFHSVDDPDDDDDDTSNTVNLNID